MTSFILLLVILVTEETAGNNVFNILVNKNSFFMLVFTNIFVFNKPIF